MITIIAAAPRTSEQADMLKRQLARFGDHQVMILEDALTLSVNRALQSATGDRILVLDDLSMPLGDWYRADFPQRMGILGGICRTYAGTRAGYALDRSCAVGKSIKRSAVALFSSRSTKPFIDLPNEGCVLIRRSLIDQIGFLDDSQPLTLALLDFALRALEMGAVIGFDERLFVDRAAAALEPTLNDEIRFAALRSERDWRALLHGPARRAELHTVHLLAHGAPDERRLQQWLKLAGYPVAQARVTEPGRSVSAFLDELEHRNRYIACVDLRIEPAQDWLLTLIEATTGEKSIGVVTGDTRAEGQRIVAADASATLVVNNRLPAQISLHEQALSLDETIAELSQKASALGVVTRSVPLNIVRVNNWKERHLDSHTLEALLRKQKSHLSKTLILLAGSAASVHRYTTDALRSYSGEVEQLFVVARSDAPKITARLRNHANVELFVDADDELAGNALSRAMAAATGDIVVLMRDDYLVAEQWLETMLAHLERMPQAGIVVPRLSGVPGVQNCEDEMFADSVEYRLAAERRRQARAREAQLVDIVQMPSFVMRRAVVEKIGGFDEVLATSHYGIIDYCIRARSVGFDIVLAEDVYVHHIPFEHTNLPQDELMSDPVYTRAFAKKWGIDVAKIDEARLSALIHSAAAHRHKFVKLAIEQDAAKRPSIRSDEERVVLLLPLEHEDTWQSAGNVVRKYLSTFTSEDRVTLAIGRQDNLRTSVVAQRVRKMISETMLEESAVPDIVISDSGAREHWLSSLPTGPRYLLLADEKLPTITVWDDLSPSGLRRAVSQLAPSLA